MTFYLIKNWTCLNMFHEFLLVSSDKILINLKTLMNFEIYGDSVNISTTCVTSSRTEVSHSMAEDAVNSSRNMFLVWFSF